MDDSAERTRVDWRDWHADAFDAAERAGKPILLSLTTHWCGDCHEMDRETYDDPRIAANVNDGFVPVRVDADRRPRVRERYNMGGFPSTVFLAPDGTILSGAGSLGADGFREILTSVRGAWDARGTDAGSVPRALRDGTPPGGELTATIERQMLGQLVDQYDTANGGWGDDAKFPLARTIEFALKRERDQATRTLDAIDASLRDTTDGGFYRFAEHADWSGVHREKLLDANAALLRAFANAYLYTGRDAYRDAATDTVDYLTERLWTGDAFAGSQRASATRAGVDEQSTSDGPAGEQSTSDGPAGEQSTSDAPVDDAPVDETAHAGRNALAADALLVLSAYTDDDRARRYGERALAFVRDTLVDDDGAVTHYAVDGDVSAASPRGVLADQARVLGALCRARQVAGAPTHVMARSVADWTIEHLADSATPRSERTDGDPRAAFTEPATGREPVVFRDGPATGAGLLDESLYPLDGNVALADALLDLAVLTGDDRYERIGRRALEAFAGAADRFGVRVATYAATVSRYREHPLVIAVGDDAGCDLHRAALRMADHEKVVVPNADGVDEAVASVRRGDEAYGTAETPAALADLVAETV